MDFELDYTKEYVSCVIQGGLGNQLFQIACVLNVQRCKKYVSKITYVLYVIFLF